MFPDWVQWTYCTYCGSYPVGQEKCKCGTYPPTNLVIPELPGKLPANIGEVLKFKYTLFLDQLLVKYNNYLDDYFDSVVDIEVFYLRTIKFKKINNKTSASWCYCHEEHLSSKIAEYLVTNCLLDNSQPEAHGPQELEKLLKRKLDEYIFNKNKYRTSIHRILEDLDQTLTVES